MQYYTAKKNCQHRVKILVHFNAIKAAMRPVRSR